MSIPIQISFFCGESFGLEVYIYLDTYLISVHNNIVWTLLLVCLIFESARVNSGGGGENLIQWWIYHSFSLRSKFCRLIFSVRSSPEKAVKESGYLQCRNYKGSVSCLWAWLKTQSPFPCTERLDYQHGWGWRVSRIMLCLLTFPLYENLYETTRRATENTTIYLCCPGFFSSFISQPMIYLG